jgi:L-seryl-tRNA(Ser) seleniumtransferase
MQREGAAPVTDLVREVLAEHRAESSAPATTDLVAEVLDRARTHFQPSLRPVINATGVIIHTNLGRAPLSPEAQGAMAAVSRGYSNLEFDLEGGGRGSRSAHLEKSLISVTGAESAMAVNNNASALLLVLSALCAGREVVISRGQAVEIGGGFRIPDVMKQSGASLVEVGTTNRTYLADYEAAMGEETAALIRVHTSNFRVIGFTSTVDLPDLVALARRKGLLVLDDLGSGCLLDTRPFGLGYEPTVQESVAAGADLVMFSGDKLLGGPQAGIVVGRRKLIEQLKRHPLARALRMDKGSIAALNATLRHYQRGEALDRVPVWRMIAMPLSVISRRARRWQRAAGPIATVVEGRSMIGGGSLPAESLPTTLVAVSEAEGLRPEEVARAMRSLPTPIVARVARNQLLLDPRTVDPGDDRYVATELARISPAARAG